MTTTEIEFLSFRIDVVFFILAATVFGTEAIKGFVNRSWGKQTAIEIMVNLFTLLPYTLIQFVVFAGAYACYVFISSHFISWRIDNSLFALVAVVLIADFFYYWEHRLAHKVRLLWVQHAVHHSSRQMNVSTASRTGPFEGVWAMLISAPILFLGFTPELLVFGMFVVISYQAWIHTELIKSLGPLELFLNTPAAHRVHHGNAPEYQDKNFGGVLIIWDRLFGTYQAETVLPEYGLARDFDSKNPLKVCFSEYPALFRDLTKASSLKEFCGRLFYAPGWQPETQKSSAKM